MAEQRPPAACPDLETLAAYVDGTIDPSARGGVTAHLAACERCYELVSELASAELQPTAVAVPAGQSTQQPAVNLQAKAGRPVWRSGWLQMAATVLIAIGGMAMLYSLNPPWWDRLWRPAPDVEVAPLVLALGDQRAIEGRLSGGFRYGPLLDSKRSASTLADNLSLVAAAGTLQKRSESNPTPQNRHAWGVSQLLMGRFDESVETLAGVHADNVRHATYANDLGVAHMTRGLATDRAEDLPTALNFIDQAIEMDPGLAEAWFNKALLLERLRIRQQAIDAWNQYLQLDGSGEWSDYARQRRDRLVAQPPQGRWPALEKELRGSGPDTAALKEAARAFPEDLRDLLIREWLPAWASAVARDGSEAMAGMTRIQSTVEALAAERGDPYFTLVGSQIRDARGLQRETLARGIARLAAGSRALAADEYRNARADLQQAQSAFDACGSALLTWTQLELARIAYVENRPAETASLLEAVLAESDRLKSPVLAARAGWLGGILAFTSGDWGRAAEQYEMALRAAEHSGESQLASRVHLNASVLNRFLGNRDLTWAHRMAAVDGVPPHRPSQFHGYLITGAVTASLQDMPRTALIFQNEVVAFARERLPVSHGSEALLTRARMSARLGHHDRASPDLIASARALETITDPVLLRRLRRSWLVAAAEVNVDRSPKEAAAYAAEAISINAGREPMRSAEVRLLESRALAKLGNVPAARASATQGITDFEQALDTLDPMDSTRLSALEPVWQLYSHAARLHLPPWGNDYATAFELSERSRSRTILARRRQKPQPLAAVQARLRPGQVLILLDQLPTELLTWSIWRDEVQVARSGCGERDVTSLIARHRRAIAQGEFRDAASAELFECVMRPWWSRLNDVSVVAIVPDSGWHAVAWPALWERSSGRELVHRVFTVVAPSASVAVGSTRRDAIAGNGGVLVISATAGDAIYAALPGARAEARAIAELYGGARLVEGIDATPARLRKEAPAARLIHVAGHAVDVPAYPLLSHLILAGADRSLFARDIASLDLSSTDVVVLAACGTAGRRSVRGEGSVGVAWGFLTAGARRVVATLDEVDDNAIGEMFVEVHRHLARGVSAVEAVGRVQRTLAARGESPRLWAMVTVVGEL